MISVLALVCTVFGQQLTLEGDWQAVELRTAKADRQARPTTDRGGIVLVFERQE
jgi:hypothetical protein